MIIEIATLPPAVQAWIKTLPFEGDFYLVRTGDKLIISEQPIRHLEKTQKTHS